MHFRGTLTFMGDSPIPGGIPGGKHVFQENIIHFYFKGNGIYFLSNLAAAQAGWKLSTEAMGINSIISNINPTPKDKFLTTIRNQPKIRREA